MTEKAQAKRVRVMLVEDHADFRALMGILLGRQPDIKLLAQAGSLAEARTQTASSEIDVAVLDLGLPDGNGVDLIADLRRASHDVRVLVLSASLDPAGIEKARNAGADEILDKLTPVDEVLATIRRLARIIHELPRRPAKGRAIKVVRDVPRPDVDGPSSSTP